jgi:uncharacterized membrane protein YeiH
MGNADALGLVVFSAQGFLWKMRDSWTCNFFSSGIYMGNADALGLVIFSAQGFLWKMRDSWTCNFFSSGIYMEIKTYL